MRWQRKGVAKLELRSEGSRRSHRSAVVGRHDESGDQYDSPEQRQHIAGRASPECAAALHPDHAVHWTSIGSHRQCATRLGYGSVASARPRLLMKNNARLVVMMLEVLAFPVDTNDVVNGLETMERKIKEFERHANIDIPKFLEVGIVIRQTEEGPMRTHLILNAHRLTTFPDIKAEVTNVKHAQCAVMTKVWTRSRRDRPKELPKVLETAKTPRSCAGTAKRKATERQSAARDTKGVGKGKSTGAKKGDGNGAGKGKKRFEGKCFGRRSRGTCRKTAGPRRRMRSRRTRMSLHQRLDASNMASIKVRCTGDRVSTSVRRKPPASQRNRLTCSSDSVPEDSG